MHKIKRFGFALIIIFPFVMFSQEIKTLATIDNNFGDGMIVSPNGDILISGGYNKKSILKITKEGEVSNYIDNLPGPVGMGFDSKGNLYVANYSGNSISKITPNKEVIEFASGLDGPAGLIVNSNDEIFVTLYGANFSGRGSKVLKFNADGSYENYVSDGGIMDAIGITKGVKEQLYVTNFNDGNLFKLNANNTVTRMLTIPDAKINQIAYFNEYIYIPSPNLKKIFRVNTVTNRLETFAGNDTIVNGSLRQSQFNNPNSCAIDADEGKLYILENKLGLLKVINFNKKNNN